MTFGLKDIFRKFVIKLYGWENVVFKNVHLMIVT